MKKVIQFLSIVFLFVLTFTSCTSSDATVEEKLLSRLVEMNTDGTSATYNFTYNGNKIVSITSENSATTFTYTGDLITRITELDLASVVETTFDYSYTDNRLTHVICSENYELNYVYNADGTVSYEKITHDTSGNVVLLFHGVMTFSGENVNDSKKTFDDTPVTILLKEEVSFAYDAKRNPFSNITGYSKLLDHFTTISAYNTASSIEMGSTSYLDADQAVSWALLHQRVFQYDVDDYPTEIVSDKAVLGNQSANHLETLYFYE